ncbi:hypothetical protein KY362_03960 [Candidatus Woesearchaeota archaeon]|nr:hypothetical protein [Candidatus Woesearchaeota archaeon]
MTGENRIKEDVPQDKAFRLANGSYIKNLNELYSALLKADDAVFSHHVTESRNDFGNWVKDVHKDYRLANSIFRAQDKESAARAVKDRLYELEKTVDARQKTQSVALLPSPASETKKDPVQAAQVSRPRPMAKGARSLFESAMEAARLREKGLSLRKKEGLRPEPSLQPPTPELAKKDAKETARLEQKLEDISSTEKLAMNIHSSRGSFSKKEAVEDTVVDTALEAATEEPSVVINDPAEEMIRFAENNSFRKQFFSEITGVFSKGSLKSVSSEMRRAFAISRPQPVAAKTSGVDAPAEPAVPRKSFRDRLPSMPKMSLPKPRLPKMQLPKFSSGSDPKVQKLSFSPEMLRNSSAEDDTKKKEMLDHLKRVYK